MYYSRGPKTHFVCDAYILYIFYITFNKRKKWESGPRCPQTLVLPRFRWPGFENKSGPRAKKSGPKYFSVRTNSSTAQIKVGQTHFQISISGPKRKGGCSPDNQSSSMFSAKVLALYKYSSSSQLSNILSNPLMPDFTSSINLSISGVPCSILI